MTEAGSTTRCRHCHKPIVWPGLCYTCATGLPRQVRPREKAAADQSPGHQVASRRGADAEPHLEVLEPLSEEALGEARQRHASPNGLDGVQHAAG